MVIISAITPAVINKINPYEMDLYPNYLWVYVHHYLIPANFTLGLTAAYYYKKPSLRKHFAREFKNFIEQIKTRSKK